MAYMSTTYYLIEAWQCRQWCFLNKQQNNISFLSETVTYIIQYVLLISELLYEVIAIAMSQFFVEMEI